MSFRCCGLRSRRRSDVVVEQSPATRDFALTSQASAVRRESMGSRPFGRGAEGRTSSGIDMYANDCHDDCALQARRSARIDVLIDARLGLALIEQIGGRE